MHAVTTAIVVDGGESVHLFQAIRRNRNGFNGHYVVTGIDGDEIQMNDPDFAGVPVTVAADEFVAQGYEPLAIDGGVPVWGY